jgi:hypothetical protein
MAIRMNYQTDWRDNLRHLANVCFIGTYLFFDRAMILQGACCTIVGELLLAPSAVKHRSWSTIIVGGISLFLALRTITRFLLS